MSSSSSLYRFVSCSSFSRGSIESPKCRSGGAAQARRLHQRVEVRVPHVARLALAGVARVAAVGEALLAKQRHLQRCKRDLELLVVGLDGRDLLDEEARPEQDAERAGRAPLREHALD